MASLPHQRLSEIYKTITSGFPINTSDIHQLLQDLKNEEGRHLDDNTKLLMLSILMNYEKIKLNSDYSFVPSKDVLDIVVSILNN